VIPASIVALHSEARGHSSAGRAPALQAGGRRFDPGWLHSQNPCKRAIFATRAPAQTPVAGVRWKRFGSPLLGTGWLSRHGRRRTSQEACDEGGCGSRGRRALWGGLHGGGCVPTATLRRPRWLPPSASARRWRAWSDRRYAHRSGGEIQAEASPRRRRNPVFPTGFRHDTASDGRIGLDRSPGRRAKARPRRRAG
jgi:hypothetical protein